MLIFIGKGDDAPIGNPIRYSACKAVGESVEKPLLYYRNNLVSLINMLELLSEKFWDVMWLFNQFVFSNVASRLASAILEHRALEGSDEFSITHDALARDLGTAREVVTRLLKQFQLDGLVELSRGRIKVTDAKKLSRI